MSTTVSSLAMTTICSPVASGSVVVVAAMLVVVVVGAVVVVVVVETGASVVVVGGVPSRATRNPTIPPTRRTAAAPRTMRIVFWRFGDAGFSEVMACSPRRSVVRSLQRPRKQGRVVTHLD